VLLLDSRFRGHDKRPQEGFDIGDIGEAVLAVGGYHFQSVTICHRLTSFLAESFFELVPVFPGGLEIGLLDQDPDDIHHGKKPGVGCFIVQATDLVIFKDGQIALHGSSTIVLWIRWGSGARRRRAGAGGARRSVVWEYGIEAPFTGVIVGERGGKGKTITGKRVSVFIRIGGFCRPVGAEKGVGGSDWRRLTPFSMLLTTLAGLNCLDIVSYSAHITSQLQLFQDLYS
jgi:hypothetical protein